jgi:hypothetical protein
VPVNPTIQALSPVMPRSFANAFAETIWISRPSRIQAVPSPTTTVQWNRVHGNRSIRAGMRLRIVLPCVAVVDMLRNVRPGS